MNNLSEYTEGAEFLSGFSNWEEKITQGQGNAYGFELFSNYKNNKFDLLLSYTLAWSNRIFPDLNLGRQFPYRYDRRHEINLTAVYQWKPNITINSNWVLQSGNAVSFPTTTYSSASNALRWRSYEYNQFSTLNQLQWYSGRNNIRLPIYHRLDIGIDISKQKIKTVRIWRMGIYNIYFRRNPFSYYQVSGYVNKLALRGLSLLPFVPYFDYVIKF
jgi:hypothetical protein